MTPEKVIELAEQAGFMLDDAPIIQPYVIQPPHYKIDDEIKRFARLVRNEALEEAAESYDQKAIDAPTNAETFSAIHIANELRSMKK